MSTRESYDKKLAELYQELLRMGILVEDNLKVSKDLLLDKNKALVDKVKITEKEVNALELSLEDKFITLIATEQPVARDLRKVIASLKILSHLERMGDYAVHVAKYLRKLDERTLTPFAPPIRAMIDKNIAMLDETLSAFVANDTEKAKAAAALDDEIDTEHDHFTEKLYEEATVVRTSKEFATLLFLGRYLERLGDLVTNICEWIVYSGESRHVELND